MRRKMLKGIVAPVLNYVGLIIDPHLFMNFMVIVPCSRSKSFNYIFPNSWNIIECEDSSNTTIDQTWWLKIIHLTNASSKFQIHSSSNALKQHVAMALEMAKTWVQVKQHVAMALEMAKTWVQVKQHVAMALEMAKTWVDVKHRRCTL